MSFRWLKFKGPSSIGGAENVKNQFLENKVVVEVMDDSTKMIWTIQQEVGESES